jgi:hypothetical protein
MEIIKCPKSALYVIMTAIIVWSQCQSLVKHSSLNIVEYVVLAYASFQLIDNSWDTSAATFRFRPERGSQNT